MFSPDIYLAQNKLSLFVYFVLRYNLCEPEMVHNLRLSIYVIVRYSKRPSKLSSIRSDYVCFHNLLEIMMPLLAVHQAYLFFRLYFASRYTFSPLLVLFGIGNACHTAATLEHSIYRVAHHDLCPTKNTCL